MLVLTIDTATPSLTIGLVDASDSAVARVLAQKISEDTRGHNEKLTPMVQEALAEAGISCSDLDAVVVGCGPGPFTGLRVGMASAAAFADALNIPVYRVCSLDAIAQTMDDSRVLVVTDARRREIYYATYRDKVRISGPAVVKPAELSVDAGLDSIVIPQQLATSLPSQFSGVRKVEGTPTPLGLVNAVDFTQAPQPLKPLYLRWPDAAEPKPRPQSPAIPKVEV